MLFVSVIQLASIFSQEREDNLFMVKIDFLFNSMDIKESDVKSLIDLGCLNVYFDTIEVPKSVDQYIEIKLIDASKLDKELMKDSTKVNRIKVHLYNEYYSFIPLDKVENYYYGEIASFSISGKSCFVTTAYSESNRFSLEQINYLGCQSRGDRIWFHDVIFATEKDTLLLDSKMLEVE